MEWLKSSNNNTWQSANNVYTRHAFYAGKNGIQVCVVPPHLSSDPQNMEPKHSDHIKGKYNNLTKHIWLNVQKGAQDAKFMFINLEDVIKSRVLAVICTFVGSV